VASSLAVTTTHSMNTAFHSWNAASSCCEMVFSVDRLYKKINERCLSERDHSSRRRSNFLLKEYSSIQIFKEIFYVASCAMAVFKAVFWEFDFSQL
jgi:hypothetical protein